MLCPLPACPAVLDGVLRPEANFPGNQSGLLEVRVLVEHRNGTNSTQRLPVAARSSDSASIAKAACRSLGFAGGLVADTVANHSYPAAVRLSCGSALLLEDCTVDFSLSADTADSVAAVACAAGERRARQAAWARMPSCSTQAGALAPLPA